MGTGYHASDHGFIQSYVCFFLCVWYEISTIIIFYFPSHFSHIIHLVVITDCLFQPPTTLVWFTSSWISTFGRERRVVTLNHLQPWMKRSWRESSLSAAVTADCRNRSIPSLLTWYDGRWYSTTAHWAQMLAGGAWSVRRPWQTRLYSFNPKVLKQHLTQIEVGFVIAEEEEKNDCFFVIHKALLKLLHPVYFILAIKLKACR